MGACSDWEHYGDAFVFDARTVEWRPLAIAPAAVIDPRVRRFVGALPPRRGHVAGLLPLTQPEVEARSECAGLLVVFGGTNGGVDGGTLNDVHVLRVAPAPPLAATAVAPSPAAPTALAAAGAGAAPLALRVCTQSYSYLMTAFFLAFRAP